MKLDIGYNYILKLLDDNSVIKREMNILILNANVSEVLNALIIVFLMLSTNNEVYLIYKHCALKLPLEIDGNLLQILCIFL